MNSLQDCLHVFTKQLLDRNPSCFDVAKKFYLERLPKSQGQPATLSIDEKISLIKQLCLSLNTVFIVVDALDECTDRDSFSRCLLSLSEGNPKIKLFLTSRYEVELERLVFPMASHHLSLKEHMRSDIKSFLNHETATRLAQGTLKLRQEGLAVDIVSAIEEKADGM
jgi:hypothetical protein